MLFGERATTRALSALVAAVAAAFTVAVLPPADMAIKPEEIDVTVWLLAEEIITVGLDESVTTALVSVTWNAEEGVTVRADEGVTVAIDERLTVWGADKDEMATTAALIVEVTADPDKTIIGLPEGSLGSDIFSRMPAPTSFIRMVKVPPVEFKTVRLSAISLPQATH